MYPGLPSGALVPAKDLSQLGGIEQQTKSRFRFGQDQGTGNRTIHGPVERAQSTFKGALPTH